jgi:GLUG motif-containing protein
MNPSKDIHQPPAVAGDSTTPQGGSHQPREVDGDDLVRRIQAMLAKKVVELGCRVGPCPTRCRAGRIRQASSFSLLVLIPFFTFTFFLLTCSHADYADGDGSAEFPYEIAEPNQLIYMSQHPEHWGLNFILTTDINMNLADPNTFTTALIAPDTNGMLYSFQGTAFKGVFDGNGHIISNLTIDTAGVGNDYLGLFGQIDGSNAEIKNLGLENVNITGGDGSGNLGCLCGFNSGSISNCYTTGTVAGGNDSSCLGGLVGYNDEGRINNCYATDSVISGDGSWMLGGLCGYSYDGNISNCYATGSVTGGINTSNLGGLCGHNHLGSISNCLSTGSITGDGDIYLGGLCGRNGFGLISLCYFLDSAGPDNGLGTPLPDNEMKQQNSFIGWDFVGETANGTSSWWIIHAGEYPSLFFFDPSFVPHIFVGQGTDNDPYLIYDPNELGAIWQQPDRYYQLQNDINLDGISWPVAVIPEFDGVFDGEGNIISNLNISGGSNLGLIGISNNNASVIRLGLECSNITGGDFLGSLCGKNFGNITNCYATGSVSGGDYSNYLGGLCGKNYNDINNSYTAVSVTGGNSSYYLGGLCGYNDKGSISNCSAIGSVSGRDNSDRLGGLCGESISGNINNCYATGSVTGGDNSDYLGGLCGYSYSSNIGYCYASESVTAGDNSLQIGGLCGENNQGTIDNCYSTCSVVGGSSSMSIGGLCGRNSNGYISFCYATGSVSGGDDSHYLGGICGGNSQGDIFMCYSNGLVTVGIDSSFIGGLCGHNTKYSSSSACYFLNTAGPDNGYGQPLDDPNMRIQSSFVNWDFVGDSNGTEDHWKMCIDGYDYPRLAWQFINPADFLHPGRVDQYDLYVLTHDWLTEISRCCDIAPLPTGDGIVNLLDYQKFSEYWLREISP